ncbi:MAG: hydroxymethylglutaryl-CoA synthase family protein [Spirochaetales bacterium]|nr:hydroxymethylglutaryl-CoA synthase family protein [Spirochaetales bacterium]
MNVGIEAINLYGGPAYVDVKTLFEKRGLNLERFDNLMMKKKSVGLPCEDGVTNAVNAAKPIMDLLSPEDKHKIELVITSTESGLDFGKSLSTYIHDYLDLSRHCRLFEVKQACYGGTSALQMAVCFIASGVSPGAKALVIATDTARAAAKKTYAEPTQSVGAVAMLVSDNPEIMEIDLGATGHYSYEVMDTCRPLPEIELGDADLSLLTYLDCFENSFKHYQSKVEGVDFIDTFNYLAFHTPFAGMVKGAHRNLMRKMNGISMEQIEHDFQKRVEPSLKYCVLVGNIYSATVYMAVCSLVDTVELDNYNRIGIFSYGSGCSSEFYSGLISPRSKEVLRKMKIAEHLGSRYELDFEEYDRIIDMNMEWVFGIKDKEIDISKFSNIYEQSMEGKNMLVLKKVNGYHREYMWS